MKKNDTKASGLTVLAFLLVLLVSTLLIGCVTAYRHVYYDPIADAAASVPLQDVTVRSQDGSKITLAQYINDTYIKNERISETNVKNMLRDGDFHLRVGEHYGMIAQYIALHRSHPEDVSVPEIMPADVYYAITLNASTIRLHTGLNDATELEAPILANVEADCVAYNAKLTNTLTKGLSAFLIDAAVSHWVWYVLGGLLLALLIWMIVMQKKQFGTAIKTFSIAAGIPCLVLLLWGALGTTIVKLMQMGYLQNAVRILRGTWLAIGALGLLGCVALFGIGAIASQIAAGKAAPAPAPVPAAEQPVEKPAVTAEPAADPTPVVDTVTDAAPAEDAPKRRFCRFCGEPLVNNDALFCYKCGTQQAKVELDKTDQDAAAE